MPTELTKKQVYSILSVFTVIGFLLRFYRLDFQGLWYDELHSIIPTHPDASVSSIIEYCKLDQPPAFFLYLKYFFTVFGYSEYSGRAASAMIGVISIPAMYALGKECKNNMVGLGAALITTVNYFAIIYSQELRFYSFAFLFTTLSFLFFLRAFKYNKTIDYCLYTLSTAILLYTHYFGMVIFATQVFIFISLWVWIKPSTSFIVKGLLAGVAAGLSFTFWLPVIFNDLEISAFWIQRPKPLFLAEYFYGYFGKDAITAIISLVFLFFMFKNLRNESQTNQSKGILIVLILWLVLSYVIPLVRSLTSAPVLHIRYTIVTLPAWIVLFAWGWTLIPQQRLKFALAIVVALSSIFNLFLLRKHYSKITKQQFREAAAVVLEKADSSAVVVSTFPWHYGFYFRNSSINVGSVTDSLRDSNSFWLLPVQTFSSKEIEDEINKFPGFEIKERYLFNKTEAILMVKKE